MGATATVGDGEGASPRDPWGRSAATSWSRTWSMSTARRCLLLTSPSARRRLTSRNGVVGRLGRAAFRCSGGDHGTEFARRAHDRGRAGMSIARAAAVGSLVVAIIAVGVLMFGGGGGTEYTVRMQTANQLVKGNQVRVGGLRGRRRSPTSSCRRTTRPTSRSRSTTTSLPCAADRRSRCARSRSPRSRTATSRCIPGPTTARRSRTAGLLDADETTNVVDLDQLFNTLDPKARKGLQGVLRGFGTWYVGQSDNLQDTFKYLAPSLGNLSRGDGGAGARPEDVREPDRERRQGDSARSPRGATTWPSWSRTATGFARALGQRERGARPHARRAAGRARGGQRHVPEPALGARPPERADRRLQAADQGPGAVPAAVRAPVRDDATDVRGPARPGQRAGAATTTRST